MSLVGKVGVFTSVNDGAWGKEYGDKQCKVLEVEGSETDAYYGLYVEFEDGKRITITDNEFEEVLN